jgi:hypothetical protein
VTVVTGVSRRNSEGNEEGSHGYNFDHHSTVAVNRCFANLALQLRVGLLSERRPGTGSGYRGCTAAHGKTVSGCINRARKKALACGSAFVLEKPQPPAVFPELRRHLRLGRAFLAIPLILLFSLYVALALRGTLLGIVGIVTGVAFLLMLLPLLRITLMLWVLLLLWIRLRIVFSVRIVRHPTLLT